MIDVELIVQTTVLHMLVNPNVRSICVRYRKQCWTKAREGDNNLTYR
jgi:hypothetical protein